MNNIKLNIYLLFSKTLLFLMSNIKLDGVPKKIKWKIHTLYTVFQGLKALLINIYKIQPSVFNFLLIYISFSIVSADIIFHNFYKLHLTLIESRFFITNFPFLTDSIKHPPPPHPPPMLNRQNPSVMKVFCQCSLIIICVFISTIHLQNSTQITNTDNTNKYIWEIASQIKTKSFTFILIMYVLVVGKALTEHAT